MAASSSPTTPAGAPGCDDGDASPSFAAATRAAAKAPPPPSPPPAPYDVCTVLPRARRAEPTSLFLPAVASKAGKSGGGYTFWGGTERFALGAKLNAGESGTVYAGTFGTRAIAVKINNPKRVGAAEDFHEVSLQTKLFCHLRDKKAAATTSRRPTARIPEVFFAATVPRKGRALGMEKVDVPLLKRLLALPGADAQRALLREALARVAALLATLQADLQFMHGDLHGENVMLRLAPTLEVFVIDLGMASARLDGKATRTVTDARYRGAPFNPHLDLLTLLTALREDLALEGRAHAAAWCDAHVRPFWETVRGGLFSGKARAALPYSAHRTVRAARREITASGEIYYAHHLLYEQVRDVAYPPCLPTRFLAELARGAKAAKAARAAPLASARIFEDA